MTERLILLCTDINDGLDYVLRQKPKGHVTMVWAGCMRKLIEKGPFDKLLVTAAVHGDPRAQTWIAACRTRVRGSDGKTVGERLVEQ